jgi:hypothetical protein
MLRRVISPRRALALFAGGGVGLALCDQIHVRTGVLDYDTGGFFGQAWWVPLQFGVASLAIVLGAAPFAARRADPRRLELVTGVGWFVAAYAATGLFHAHPDALAGTLSAGWILRVALARERGVLVTYSLLLAAAGTGVEGMLSAAGTFAYADPDFLRVPEWLPALYLNGAPFALALSGALTGRSGTRSPAGASPAPRRPGHGSEPESG